MYYNTIKSIYTLQEGGGKIEKLMLSSFSH